MYVWIETYGDIFEENYVFKDITKNIGISITKKRE